MNFDFGDIVLSLNAAVKGLQPPRIAWRIGAPADTQPSDRTPGTRPRYLTPPRKVDFTMDLQADKKVTLAVTAQDEVGNPTEFDGTIVYAVDDPSIINLTDNGDGTAEAAATGALGAALLTAVATRADGREATAAFALNVVAGDAETFTISAGEPTEVTPDSV